MGGCRQSARRDRLTSKTVADNCLRIGQVISRVAIKPDGGAGEREVIVELPRQLPDGGVNLRTQLIARIYG